MNTSITVSAGYYCNKCHPIGFTTMTVSFKPCIVCGEKGTKSWKPSLQAGKKCHCGRVIKGEGEHRHCPVAHYPAKESASSEETLEQAKELQRGSVIPSRPERVGLRHAIEKMHKEKEARDKKLNKVMERLEEEIEERQKMHKELETLKIQTEIAQEQSTGWMEENEKLKKDFCVMREGFLKIEGSYEGSDENAYALVIAKEVLSRVSDYSPKA